MRRRNCKKPYQPKALKPSLKRHLKALGHRCEDDYYRWCAEQRLPVNLNKDLCDREAELERLWIIQEDLREHARIHHNPIQFLRDACAGMLRPQAIRRPLWKGVCQAISESRDEPRNRQDLAKMLMWLHKKSNLVLSRFKVAGKKVLCVQALVIMHQYRDMWIRKLEDWKPQSHNLWKQFHSLVNHLFVKYPLPGFFYVTWFRRDPLGEVFRQCFIELALGKNIRKMPFPVALTKKMAHLLMQTPNDELPLEKAVIRAGVLGVGGSEQLASIMVDSDVNWDLRHFEFWLSVFRFFIRFPELEKHQVCNIMSYVERQKFLCEEVMMGPNRFIKVDPIHPNFSMKGRTPATLLPKVNRDKAKAFAYEGEGKLFKKSGIGEYRLRASQKRKDYWEIRELLSQKDLELEGNVMHHCVASYQQECFGEESAIWTMEYVSSQGRKKHLTIEVTLSNKTIWECLGKYNRLPTPREFRVVLAWAGREGLKVHDDLEVGD